MTHWLSIVLILLTLECTSVFASTWPEKSEGCSSLEFSFDEDTNELDYVIPLSAPKRRISLDQIEMSEDWILSSRRLSDDYSLSSCSSSHQWGEFQEISDEGEPSPQIDEDLMTVLKEPGVTKFYPIPKIVNCGGDHDPKSLQPHCKVECLTEENLLAFEKEFPPSKLVVPPNSESSSETDIRAQSSSSPSLSSFEFEDEIQIPGSTEQLHQPLIAQGIDEVTGEKEVPEKLPRPQLPEYNSSPTTIAAGRISKNPFTRNQPQKKSMKRIQQPEEEDQLDLSPLGSGEGGYRPSKCKGNSSKALSPLTLLHQQQVDNVSPQRAISVDIDVLINKIKTILAFDSPPFNDPAPPRGGREDLDGKSFRNADYSDPITDPANSIARRGSPEEIDDSILNLAFEGSIEDIYNSNESIFRGNHGRPEEGKGRAEGHEGSASISPPISGKRTKLKGKGFLNSVNGALEALLLYPGRNKAGHKFPAPPSEDFDNVSGQSPHGQLSEDLVANLPLKSPVDQTGNTEETATGAADVGKGIGGRFITSEPKEGSEMRRDAQLGSVNSQAHENLLEVHRTQLQGASLQRSQKDLESKIAEAMDMESFINIGEKLKAMKEPEPEPEPEPVPNPPKRLEQARGIKQFFKAGKRQSGPSLSSVSDPQPQDKPSLIKGDSFPRGLRFRGRANPTLSQESIGSIFN